MEEPLLAASELEEEEIEKGKWSSYQYVGRSNSILPTASLAGTEVSVEEIRSAAAFSDRYPPSLHAALISSPEPDPHEQAIVYQGMYGGGLGDVGRQILDEVEIRELLIDHVGHCCCWGIRPARTWKIHAVEDCNVYVGTLETFIEERETTRETEPHLSGKIDGKDNGPELGIWELDLRSEFPTLFIQNKETRTKVPHSETSEKCSEETMDPLRMMLEAVHPACCAGRGEFPCPACNADQEPGFHKENQMLQCPACYGRGLIAHRDGSDTMLAGFPFSVCIIDLWGNSRKLIGSNILHNAVDVIFFLVSDQNVYCLHGYTSEVQTPVIDESRVLELGTCWVVNMMREMQWRTLSTRKVSATSGAASVPDEVFHRAKGVQLCNTQAYHCTPAFFADSFFLNKFSSEVIADRAPVPPTARVICERHAISVVPVIRVTMAHRNQSFSFYIIGLSREVYLKDYYPSRFCWGFCPCLNWLRLQ
ncbi:hypothetical protein HHK36_018913 [Tetracentron sinense]|uniref:Protein SSUH2 homolog n=1 Tax=Tetracentron sinense TaxID=13715 RepID=A0A834YSY9_TETSI|nr:hypothetical protein HHK36_018913 [Tetracentron sinense]